MVDMTGMDTPTQYAYWAGRLSAELESVVRRGVEPVDFTLARECLAEYVVWRDARRAEHGITA